MATKQHPHLCTGRKESMVRSIEKVEVSLLDLVDVQ